MRRKVGRSKSREACRSGKVRYQDHESAATALRAARGSSRQVVPVRCYACPLCRGWHLTSKAQ